MPSVKTLPDGMNWMNPMLTVSDAAKSLDFYARAFGFEKKFAMPGPDGKIMHAEMVHRNSTFMLGPECPESPARTPKSLGSHSTTLYCYVEDVDSLVTRATGAGAKLTMPATDMFWGDRCATLIDPDGHSWMFATHVKDVKPEEMHP